MGRDKEELGNRFIILPKATDGHWVRAIFGESEPAATAENRQILLEATARQAWDGMGWQVAIKRQSREFIHFKEYVKHLLFVCLHIVDTIVLPNVANAGNGASDGSAEASQTV